MILDRALQKELLTKMSSTYPHPYRIDEEYTPRTPEYRKVAANLYYLVEHGLVEKNSVTKNDGFGGYSNILIELPTITHKGMDFLADDGGLSAILGVVTVKFHEDSIKQILEHRITESDLPPEDKKSMLGALRELPAESIKHLTLKLLDKGFDNSSSAIHIIQKFFENLF
ncbi:hypothetical protein [Acinetobacter brisouii]|uniref:hypothetical protein n=1 Tax=Acinetobacter brisouii TaxID=396323 RepID=UPI0035B33036